MTRKTEKARFKRQPRRRPRIPHDDVGPRCGKAIGERCAKRPGHRGRCGCTWFELYDQARAALAELVVACRSPQDPDRLRALAGRLSGILTREPLSDEELEAHRRESRKRSKAMLERYRASANHDAYTEARDSKVRQLLEALKRALPDLEVLQAECRGHWAEEDLVYRHYHHSFKVYFLQDWTTRIVEALRALAPGTPLNKDFMAVFEDGTGRRFQTADNSRWLTVTRPIVEAYFHARYFLDMAVIYGRSLERPPEMLPSGWAAFLYLYDLR